MNYQDGIAIITKMFSDNPECAAVICEFDGSGDSGQINSTSAVAELNDEDIGDSTELPIKLGTDVQEAADEIALEALEKQGIDWYNDDGGYGHVAITRDLRIICDTNQRYTESNNYTDQFKIEDSEIKPCTPSTTP